MKVLREDGPSGLTVRRIAEVLGLSRQVVYTQYGSIAGLIDALYREGFVQLRAASMQVGAGLRGDDLVVAGCLAYRASALARPELYTVMFERPFREFTPSRESQAFAIAAFDPLVGAIETTGRDREAASSLAMSVWAVIHGLVHLELQGYFEPSGRVDLRIETAVRGLLTQEN